MNGPERIGADKVDRVGEDWGKERRRKYRRTF